MLRACGVGDADLGTPQVGIASMWWEGNPCNMHLLELSARVKSRVALEGLVPDAVHSAQLAVTRRF
jgi:dihydroxy-acid dehydratase